MMRSGPLGRVDRESAPGGCPQTSFHLEILLERHSVPSVREAQFPLGVLVLNLVEFRAEDEAGMPSKRCWECLCQWLAISSVEPGGTANTARLVRARPY